MSSSMFLPQNVKFYNIMLPFKNDKIITGCPSISLFSYSNCVLIALKDRPLTTLFLFALMGRDGESVAECRERLCYDVLWFIIGNICVSAQTIKHKQLSLRWLKCSAQDRQHTKTIVLRVCLCLLKHICVIVVVVVILFAFHDLFSLLRWINRATLKEKSSISKIKR